MSPILAVHSNWTKPKMCNTSTYTMPDYELLVMIISALTWKKFNGPIHMVTDDIGREYYANLDILDLWDKVDVELNNVASIINPSVYWAAGKLYAIKNLNVPHVMLDTDFIVWKNIYDKFTNQQLIVAHLEELPSPAYPENIYTEITIPENHSPYLKSLAPSNTAFVYFGNLEFKNYYVTKAIDFMRIPNNTYRNSTLINMVFAEQRMISICAAQQNIQITELLDGGLANAQSQHDFTHIWGYKHTLKKYPAYNFNFCRRCVDRIIKDYPEWKIRISNISTLQKYIRRE